MNAHQRHLVEGLLALKRRILVVGGAGHIGSILSPYLASGTEQGLLIDLRVVDARPMLMNHLEFKGEHVRENIYTYQDAEAQLLDFKPDVVVFMAAAVPDAGASREAPALTFDVLQPMINTFYAARICGVKKFIYVSGVVEYRPGMLDVAPLNILHSMSEDFLFEARASAKMEIAIAKPTNVYAAGTMDKRNGFLNRLLKAAHAGEKIELNPNNRADFVHVNDVVLALTGLITSNISIDRPMYISSGGDALDHVMIADLHNEVARELGAPLISYTIKPGPGFGMTYESSDTVNLIALTGHTDEPTSLELGFHKLIAMEMLRNNKPMTIPHG